MSRQIVHIVMWRMNGATAEERLLQAHTAVAAFEATRGTIAGVLDMQIGVNAYFSPSWTAFQAERGRDFSVIVDGISN